MLPSLALPTVSTDPMPLETVQQNGGLATENGQFGAVLARAGATAAATLAELTEMLAQSIAAEPADGTLPESGKDLPEATTPGDIPPPAVTLSPLPLPQALPLVQAQLPAQALTQSRAQLAAQLPAQSPTQSPAQSLAKPSIPPLPPLQSLPLPLPAATASPAAALATAIVTPGKPQVPPATPLALATAIQAPQQSPLRLASSQSELPSVEILAQQAALPPTAATLRLLTEAVREKPLAAVIETMPLSLDQAPVQSLGLNVAPALPGLSNLPAAAAPATIQAPHDFAQLIDRLATAREGAQPQAASLALSHADFGKVELRFANDSSGLSVTMASADPDFARAVQAAVPPVAAASDSNAAQGRQPGQGQSASHPDAGSGQSQSQSQGQSQGQATGQNTGRREPQGRGVAANPGSSTQDGASSAPGIFA